MLEYDWPPLPLLQAPTLPCLHVGRVTPPAGRQLRHGSRVVTYPWVMSGVVPVGLDFFLISDLIQIFQILKICT
jgi:hypothetical protein